MYLCHHCLYYISVITASLKFYSGQTYVNYHTKDGSVQQQPTLPLHSVTNPEEKRKIIGDTFMKVVEGVVSDLQLQADNLYLAQGTLRPDLIESASALASSKAHVIKTHHNDTELVRELRRKVRAWCIGKERVGWEGERRRKGGVRRVGR